MAAAAFALYAIAESPEQAKQALRFDPHHLVGCGLLTAAASGMVGLIQGFPYLKGTWVSVPIVGLGKVSVGPPVVFDVGVYLVVVGTAVMIILSLAEQE